MGAKVQDQDTFAFICQFYIVTAGMNAHFTDKHFSLNPNIIHGL